MKFISCALLTVLLLGNALSLQPAVRADETPAKETGTVIGKVIDSNNNPLKGAAVDVVLNIPRPPKVGDVPAIRDETLLVGSVGVDLKTHSADEHPPVAALYGGGGGLLFDNSVPSQAWANRQQWMVAGPQWTPEGIRSTRKQAGAVWGNLIVMAGNCIYAARQDFNRDKTDCTTTVFAVTNRPQPVNGTAYDLKKAPERLWEHMFKGKHDRIKAMLLAGDKLWLANQTGGTELSKLNVDAGELIVLDAATGNECFRLPLGKIPLFDGMAVAGGKLYVAMQNGEIAAFK